MKTTLLTLTVLLFGILTGVAQPATSFKYQAVVRDGQGLVIANQAVSFRISILTDTENGITAYSETQVVTTTAQGLVNLNIGEGTLVSGDFNLIDWGNHHFYLKIEIDPQGGTDYTAMGVSPLLSVPYALHAQTVTQNDDADADPTNEIQDLQLNGNILTITNNPSATNIDLSPYLNIDTDEQTLSIIGDSLAISNGNKVDLSAYKDNTDAQQLTLTGTELTIDGGNTVDLAVIQDGVNDADADPTNEIQSLSINKDTLYLSSSNHVTLPKQDMIWDTAANNIYFNDGSIGVGTSDINSSALLDINSNNKGVLVPRMTTIQRNAITSTVNGLLVYDTDYSSFFYYNGTKSKWTLIPSMPTATSDMSEALFAVLNQNGDTVFAVYPEGVRVNVADGLAKGNKGGFAVASIGSGTKATNDIMRITNDSVRIYINKSANKGNKGGFAVASIGSGTKGTGSNFMYLEPDNYFIGQESGKSIKNGLYNSFLGYQTGYSTTDANNNVFLGYKSGFSNTLGNSNVFIGNTSGYTNVTGKSNVIIGDSAGFTPDTASYNVFIGKSSGKLNLAGEKNTFMGYYSGYNNTDGYNNVFIGNLSGKNNGVGYRNVFIGSESGRDNSGFVNVFLGDQAGLSNQGNSNVFLGAQSGKYNAAGSSNVFIGKSSGTWNQYGENNVFVGTFSGTNNNSGSNNLFAGNACGMNNDSGSGNVFLGNQSGVTNTSGASNVFIGNEAGNGNIAGSSNVYLGDGAGKTGNAWYNVFVGFHSGYNTTDNGGYNVFLGHESGYSNTTGWSNNFIGQGAGYNNTTGTNNTFIGNDAGFNNLTSSGNIFIGRNAGYNSTEYGNTIIGHTAGTALATGTNNVFLGVNAALNKTGGFNNTIIGAYANTNGGDGNYNTLLGAGAGNNSTGSSNVFIGNEAGYSETASNKLYIENSSSSTPLIYGDFQSDSLVVNGKLRVNGDFSLPIVTTSSNLQLGSAHHTVLANANVTITLPKASISAGRVYVVKKITSAAGNVTIDGYGAETIDGAASQNISAQWAKMTIQCDGTAWYIIN
jgi:hypothetical protein